MPLDPAPAWRSAGAAPLPSGPDAVLGVALDGVPSVSAFDAASGLDLLRPPPGGLADRARGGGAALAAAAAARDGCQTFASRLDGGRAYRSAPPCLYGDDDVAYADVDAALAGLDARSGRCDAPGCARALPGSDSLLSLIHI